MNLLIFGVIYVCAVILLAPILRPACWRAVWWYQQRWNAMLPKHETRAERIKRLERDLGVGA